MSALNLTLYFPRTIKATVMILCISLHLGMTTKTAVSIFNLNIYFMVHRLCKFAWCNRLLWSSCSWQAILKGQNFTPSESSFFYLILGRFHILGREAMSCLQKPSPFKALQNVSKSFHPFTYSGIWALVLEWPYNKVYNYIYCESTKRWFYYLPFV